MGKYKHQEEWQRKNGYKSFSIKLYDSLYQEFGKTCERLGTTRSREVSNLMREFIDRHKEDKE